MKIYIFHLIDKSFQHQPDFVIGLQHPHCCPMYIHTRIVRMYVYL